MIYYFSGTGNSLYIAQTLSRQTGWSLRPMIPCDEETPEESEVTGMVFPVYGWRLPRIVEQFLQNLPLTKKRSAYFFAILTCGDDIGRTHELLRRKLKEKDIKLDAVWSVTMPNTYVALPGFDIDPKELQENKLKAAQQRLDDIISVINRRDSSITDVHTGTLAYVKTYILGHLFNRFLTKHKYFRHESTCIGCRKCERICPVGNIRCDGQGRPVWLHDCTMCLSCYHHCPIHSIAYGPFTQGKGQYICKKS